MTLVCFRKFFACIKGMKGITAISQSNNSSFDFLSDLIAHPKVSNRILEWAGLLALENKEWKLSETIFILLLERRTKTLDLAGLARSLKMQKRFKEAEECYLEMVEAIKEPCSLLFIVYKALGEIYLLKNDLLQAEEYYNKAGALNADCKSLSFTRAMIYLKEKNYKKAEMHFKTALSFSPHSAKAWLGLSLARKALKDNELALACLERCLDFEPSNKQALKTKKQWKKLHLNSFSSPSLDFCS